MFTGVEILYFKILSRVFLVMYFGNAGCNCGKLLIWEKMGI